jgi:hypothetical protein
MFVFRIFFIEHPFLSSTALEQKQHPRFHFRKIGAAKKVDQPQQLLDSPASPPSSTMTSFCFCVPLLPPPLNPVPDEADLDSAKPGMCVCVRQGNERKKASVRNKAQL